MSAPKRWLDDAGGALSTERDLLQTGLSMDPPRGADAEVWASLLGKLPPPGAPSSPTGEPNPPAQPPADGGVGVAGKGAASAGKGALAAKGGAAATAVGGGLVKSALIGAGSAVALIATYSAVTPSRPDPAPIVTTAVTATPTAAPSAAAPANAGTGAGAEVVAPAAPSAAPAAPRAPVEARPAAPAPSPSAGVELPQATRETMLREESRLVGEARDALRRGDAAGALSMLEQIRARFPAGVLAQEREALTIEALARSGRRDEASARASAFLAAYPTSLLAARVQGFVK